MIFHGNNKDNVIRNGLCLEKQTLHSHEKFVLQRNILEAQSFEFYDIYYYIIYIIINIVIEKRKLSVL